MQEAEKKNCLFKNPRGVSGPVTARSNEYLVITEQEYESKNKNTEHEM